MKATFDAAGTGCASFCSPSRGPTSTILTYSGRFPEAPAAAKRRADREIMRGVDDGAGGGVEAADEVPTGGAIIAVVRGEA